MQGIHFKNSIYILIIFFCLPACHHREKMMSFYYWRTTFSPDTLEKQTLKDNAVHTLYIRYFDVDMPPEDSVATPLSPISFPQQPSAAAQIVPVVFFRNRVFERTPPTAIPSLVRKISSLIAQLNAPLHVAVKKIQFDCDWTESSRENYFLFLRIYKKLSGNDISCTIRLHQIKFPVQMGVPPVRQGVLMYYNLENFGSGFENSIYEPSLAHRYIPFLKTYPLDLDIALPIFSWAMQIRDGHVVRLLNKLNYLHFEQDSCFVHIDSLRYQAKSACSSGGYDFIAGDIVKAEQVTEDDLLDMVRDINHHSNRHIGNLLFYDLDRSNLSLYDKGIFKKVLDRLD